MQRQGFIINLRVISEKFFFGITLVMARQYLFFTGSSVINIILFLTWEHFWENNSKKKLIWSNFGSM